MRRIRFVLLLVTGGALPLVAALACSGEGGAGGEQMTVDTAQTPPAQTGEAQTDQRGKVEVTIRPGELKKNGRDDSLRVAGRPYWGRGPSHARVALQDSARGGQKFLSVNTVKAGMVVSSADWGDLKRILIDRPSVDDTTWADEILVIGLYTKIPPTEEGAGAISDQKRLDAAGIGLPAILRAGDDIGGTPAMAQSYYCIKCDGGIRVCGVEPICR